VASSLRPRETTRTPLRKAKELRRVVEPLITLAKTDTEARRRLALARLRDVLVVTKLFDDLGVRFKARPGGYTRILHLMRRPGDAAPMALMQLVDGPAGAAASADGEQKAGKPGAARKKTAAKKAAKKAAAPAAAPEKAAPEKSAPKKRTRKKKTAP